MKRLLTCLTITGGFCGAVYADDIPKFKDYPAKIYSGQQAPLRLDTPEARQHRTRLREAANDDINFGGRYVFTQWGAGTGCDTGALIDVKTGGVQFLPFAACNWSGYDRPFEVRSTSRLLVVAGQVGEGGPRGAHFFEFNGKEFKPVYANVTPLAAIEPAAGQAEAADITGEKLKQNPVIGPLLSCYDLALTGRVNKMMRDSPDERTYAARMLFAGGVAGLAIDVKKECDSWYLGASDIQADRARVVAAFGPLFVDYVYDEDRKFYESCVAKKHEAGWERLSKDCEKSMDSLKLR
ncbi:hypothetical protein [Sinorhizobium saheli]|uniref:hypothetical protein n=1 Tax=Sinorhizobium saheli TaxID=36856 RepID=UPI0012948A26|nr:hypothetical protein [Sinorhizobium saheli]MQW85981.1 hypothetical protein [Sinorhizobium saheli]